ncbi:MAG: hypothetical protein ABH878_10780, partial [bacterium]
MKPAIVFTTFIAALLIFAFWLSVSDEIRAEDELTTQTLHFLHVSEQGLACADCHARSTAIEQETCPTCHDAVDFDELLATFRGTMTTASAPQRLPELIMHHEKHPVEVACQQCHHRFETIGAVPIRENLSMQDCMICHSDRNGPLKCAVCHGTDSPEPPLNHHADFRKNHGIAAASNQQDCALCHQEAYCQDCHEGINLQGRIHPLNFEQTHFLEALGQTQDCLVCHETRQFCVDCHRQRMVLTHPLGYSWA